MSPCHMTLKSMNQRCRLILVCFCRRSNVLIGQIFIPHISPLFSPGDVVAHDFILKFVVLNKTTDLWLSKQCERGSQQLDMFNLIKHRTD